MRKRPDSFTSTLVCAICRTRAIVPRRSSRKRKAGHVKHMYCWNCKAPRAHVEE